MNTSGMFRLHSIRSAVRRHGGKGLVTVAGFILVILAVGAYMYFVRARTTAPYLLKMGQEQLSLRHYAQAVESLEKAAAIDPDNEEVARQLCRAYTGWAMDLGDFVERRKALEKAVEVSSGSLPGNLRLKLSKTYLGLARETSDPAVQLDLLKLAGKYSTGSDVLEILVAMKKLAASTGDYEYVLNVLSSMHDKNPTEAVTNLLVRTLVSASDSAESTGKKQVLAQRALQVAPDSELANEHMSRLSASRKTVFGSMRSAGETTASAETEPENTVPADTSPEPPPDTGAGDRAQDREPAIPESMEELPDVAEVEPWTPPEEDLELLEQDMPVPEIQASPPPVAMTLEEILEIDDIRERTDLLEGYVQEHDDAEAVYQLAEAYTRMRLETLKRVLAMNPEHQQAKRTLVEHYFQKGVKADAPDEKMQAYRQVVQFDSGHVKALHNLGMLLQKQGSFDAAIERYEEAIESDQLFAPSYLTLGLLYWQKKADLRKAASCFEFYRQLDPSSPTSKKVATYIAYLKKKLKR